MDIKDISKVKSFNENGYKDISLALLTAYSLYWLDEWMIPSTIEAVSILNFKLFPDKFSMVGFPIYPDALRTNRSLLQLGPKYRKLLTGSAKRGFFLNANGQKEAESLIKILGAPKVTGEHIEEPKISNIQKIEKGIARRTIHPEDTIEKVRESRLFKLYKESKFENPPRIHFLGMLQLYENAPAKERIKILKQIEVQARQINDSEVLQFLKEVKNKFNDYLFGSE